MYMHYTCPKDTSGVSMFRPGTQHKTPGDIPSVRLLHPQKIAEPSPSVETSPNSVTYGLAFHCFSFSLVLKSQCLQIFPLLLLVQILFLAAKLFNSVLLFAWNPNSWQWNPHVWRLISQSCWVIDISYKFPKFLGFMVDIHISSSEIHQIPINCPCFLGLKTTENHGTSQKTTGNHRKKRSTHPKKNYRKSKNQQKSIGNPEESRDFVQHQATWYRWRKLLAVDTRTPRCAAVGWHGRCRRRCWWRP